MLIVFFDWNNIVYREYVQTINKEFLFSIDVAFKVDSGKEAMVNTTRILQHDNPPAHSALFIQEFLMKHNTTIVPHTAAYSPALAPADFLMFAGMIATLKRPGFQTVEEIKETSFRCLKTIHQKRSRMHSNSGKKRWKSCISFGRNYCEGDKSDYVL